MTNRIGRYLEKQSQSRASNKYVPVTSPLISSFYVYISFIYCNGLQTTINKMAREANHSCCKKGPGYATPVDAMAGPKESLIYVTCVYTGILYNFIIFF
ncbi:putative selenium-binding protein [Helianthus annuus]|nr:putative selenium-binding protein [Helianthus annuus]KAJ0787619.1 putative selenium-binding protein [Helianthus annuus]